jgi:tRNA(Arg) A34 adenosine deaminase TadA
MTTTPPDDMALLRRTLGIARQARRNGKHPFGALLAGPDGAVLMEQENGFDLEGRVGHAETILARRAAQAFTAEALQATTMYASAEPCAMCAGTIYWAGIGRVVYALSEQKLKGLIGPHPDNLTLDLPCRTIFAAGQRQVEVVGPLAEDDAEAVGLHEGAWTHD